MSCGEEEEDVQHLLFFTSELKYQEEQSLTSMETSPSTATCLRCESSIVGSGKRRREGEDGE
jgi:hypothetical protein